MQEIIFAAMGYLLGSIPFGLVLTRLAGFGDIRAIGSGNIGATNVLRTGNKPLAITTLVLDGGKGAAAVFITQSITGDMRLAIIAGGAAFLGHLFPVWLKFKGGKGVATFIGTILALAWPIAISIIGAWLLTVALFRMSSLGALIAAGLAPLFAYIISGTGLATATALMAALIFYRHSDNIKRIISGTEPKIGNPKASV
jgi:acyl phosphate:glycerol-3-phosphate acyltransferase